MQEVINAGLNLMRRMPPSQIEVSLAGLLNLAPPEAADEFLQRVDVPLKIAKDPKANKMYILCDYNRDGDSYRSPWTNEYFPELPDGFCPQGKIRALEIEANLLWDHYRNLYYEGGYSSVYFWDIQNDNFAACFLIQKDAEGQRGLSGGQWSSIHVMECVNIGSNRFTYKLTTTIIVSMRLVTAQLGMVDLSGSMTKQATRTAALDADHTHIANMGSMIEDMESAIRDLIHSVYIGKTREIFNNMRTASENTVQAFKVVGDQLKETMSQSYRGSMSGGSFNAAAGRPGP